MMSGVPAAHPADLIESSRQEQWEHLRALISSYAERTPVRKVAVVGNAPLLPDAARAREIDSSDLVIRVNSMVLDAPGEPACLGTRCHAVILSRSTRLTRWVFQDYRKRLYLVPQGGIVVWRLGEHRGMLLDTPWWPTDLGSIPVPNGVVKARIVRDLDPDHEPGSIIPTSGTMALYLAHEMFADAEFVCAGFSFVDDVEQTQWSHHSGGRTKVNHLHRLDLESRMLRSWIDDGSVRNLS
jgi:hypothetical protein